MIKLFFIFALFCSLNLLAQPLCSDVFNNNEEFVFYKDYNLTFEEIIKYKKYFIEDLNQIELPEHDNQFIAAMTSEKSIQNIKKLMSHFEPSDQIYFIGNGFYFPYLISKILALNTRSFQNIHFLPISRPLAKTLIEDPSSADLFFSNFTIDKKKLKEKIILIDSVTSRNKKNDHSLIQVSNALRRYLKDKHYDMEDILKSVITVGIPESINQKHSYATETLTRYLQWVEKFQEKDFNDNFSFPYLDYHLDYHEAPFLQSYIYEQYFWNGKYYRIDSKGNPLGQPSYANSRKHRIHHRTRVFAIYLKIIEQLSNVN